MRRLAWFVASVLATLTVVVLLWQFRAVAVLFIFSLAIAASVRVPIARLVEVGVPRGLATALIYLISIGIIGGLLFIAASRSIGELQQAGDVVAAAYTRLKAQPPGNGFYAVIVQRLPPMDALFNAITSTQGTSLLINALGLTMTFFDAASKVVVVIVMSVYWGSDQVRFERLWLSLLPAAHRGQARNVWRAIETGVGAYLRSELIQGVMAGILLGLGYWALGLPAPALLALSGALAWFIPLLGGAAAFVLAVAAGALHGWLPAVAAAVYTLGVFLTLELVVERRLFDRRRYSAILTLIVMVALADALGLFGLLVAPPLAAAIQIFFRELVTQPAAAVPAPRRAASEFEQIGERLARVRAAFLNIEEPPPELGNLMERLDKLVGELGTATAVADSPAKRARFARFLPMGKSTEGSRKSA